MKRNLAQQLQFVKARHLIFIFLGMAVLMVASALVELHQSKKELLDLMRQQAHTLSETMLMASRNTLRTNLVVENLIDERLLTNANDIRRIYESGKMTNRFLRNYISENDLYRINIFNSKGQKIYSSQPEIHTGLEEQKNPAEILQPIFSGKADTLFLGLSVARFQSGFRYAVAIAARNRSAIVVNLNADQLLKFRREIGFGSLLQRMAANPGILYSALQDTSGIIAASGNVRELERINDSRFLYSALTDSLFSTRITAFDSIQVFEAAEPFYYEGRSIGLFRLGLSLQPLDAINSRIYRRIIIISIILFVVGFMLFTFLMVRQNLDIMNRQYQVVETYSRNIIQNVSDGIIVHNEEQGIQVFNQAAEQLFGLKTEEALGSTLGSLFEDEACAKLLDSSFAMQEMECTIKGEKKFLLVSKNPYRNVNEEISAIFVIRDLTEQKRLEGQIQRRERLAALGQLASGVAHEIRNPLNAIGTIVQQLDRDFEPVSESEEYHQLSGIVYQEVKRINKTIENFLRFARPEPLKTAQFDIREFFSGLKKQYGALTNQNGIGFNIDLLWEGEVTWDRQKMQQVLVNLMQNSMDVLKAGGEVRIMVRKIQEHLLEIRFQDNGPGIPPEILKKIFNLYFTTKAQGTGIGLSIVQRIVDQHGGIISVDSSPGKGTSFNITIPEKVL
ncbi:MAG: ATP-binding protein [Calditrichia bacterium]